MSFGDQLPWFQLLQINNQGLNYLIDNDMQHVKKVLRTDNLLQARESTDPTGVNRLRECIGGQKKRGSRDPGISRGSSTLCSATTVKCLTAVARSLSELSQEERGLVHPHGAHKPAVRSTSSRALAREIDQATGQFQQPPFYTSILLLATDSSLVFALKLILFLCSLYANSNFSSSFPLVSL